MVAKLQCSGITKAKELCKNEATEGSYCWHHAPEAADARRRRASKGGKAGGNGRTRSFARGEVGDLKRQLAELYDETLAGDVDRGTAAVLAQIVNARTRLLDFEHRRDAPGLITPEENIEQMHMIFEVVQRYVPGERLKDLRDDFDAVLSGVG